MARILFLPSDHGGGRGHVNRCLYLAKKAQAAGYPSAIVLEKKHYSEGLNAGLTTYLLPTERERWIRFQLKRPFLPKLELKETLRRPPVFVQFDGLDYQVPRDGYLSDKIARFRLRWLERFVARFKPDLLIGDGHSLTFILGRKLELPVVQLTRQIGFAPAPEFFWWKEQPPAMVRPDGCAPFRSLLEGLKMGGMKRAENLLRGDRYIIPALPEMEPINKSDETLIYSGPLSEYYPRTQKIPFFAEKNEVPHIYISIGGGAQRGQEHQLFESLIDIFKDLPYKVLISTAARVPAKRFKNRAANMLFVDWIDGVSAIQQSDLVIFHGGYGTTMEVLLSGKPAIVIPFHSEQEGNGRRLEKLGFGRVILPYHPDGQLQTLHYDWPYGEYQMQAAFEFELNQEAIHEAVSSLLYGGVYEPLNHFADRLKQARDEFHIEDILPA